MTYSAKDYGDLIGMEGFSDTLLKNHFTLYQGYVNNTNKVCDLLGGKAKDATDPEYAELKRRLGFEFNGMRLHEYYFENLGGKSPVDKSGALAKKLADAYRRVELHDMARRVKCWRSGNKIGLAAALLGWRDRARRSGQKFLNEVREYQK